MHERNINNHFFPYCQRPVFSHPSDHVAALATIFLVEWYFGILALPKLLKKS